MNKYLTSGEDRHTFQSNIIIPAKGFCVVWGGGNPTGFTGPYDLCNYTADSYKFDLTINLFVATGSAVRLKNASGTIIDSVGYGTQYGLSYPPYQPYALAGKALARYPDGSDNWQEAVYPKRAYTPLAPNE